MTPNSRINHYDVIWFRSFYEKETLEKIGFIFPAVRWQHSFGFHGTYKDLPSKGNSHLSTLDRHPVNSEDEILPAFHKSETERKWSVIVCFYNYIQVCTFTFRKVIAGPVDSKLVLLGGTLSDWMNFPDFLGTTDINDILLASNESTNLALLLLESSKEVHIMHGTRLTHDISPTTNDVIWPVVFAATKDINVRLSSAHSHLQSLANVDSQV